MRKRTCMGCEFCKLLDIHDVRGTSFGEYYCCSIDDNRLIFKIPRQILSPFCPLKTEPKDECLDCKLLYYMTAGGWISVSEKLPPQDAIEKDIRVSKTVFVLLNNDDTYSSFGFYVHDSSIWRGRDLQPKDIVTHWMPIPELPQKKKCPTCGRNYERRK